MARKPIVKPLVQPLLPPAAEKDSKPQGTLQAMAAGLSIGHEPGITVMNRYGPAIALLLVVALKILLATNILPNPGPVDALSDFILAGAGFGVGGWAGRLGAKVPA